MPRHPRTCAVVVAALAVLATAAPVSAASDRAAKQTACFGKKPTVFSSKNGATLKGTGKADVIEATGKNVVVNAGGGNDRICVKNANSINAGAGDDRVQLVSGKVAGGAGKDSVTVLPGSGNVRIDGGDGPNTFSVPATRLLTTMITYHSGDAINGSFARLDAPAGAPSFDIGYSGHPGPAVLYTERQPYYSAYPGAGSRLSFFAPLAPNGRALTHWSVSWGDGSPSQAGDGGPPSTLPHYFLTSGAHTVTATIVDSLGVSATRTQVVNVGFYGTPAISQAGGNVATAAAKTFTLAYTPGTGSAARSWYVRFSDGTATGGNGAPPATVSHTYTTPGGYEAYLYVVDDHGDVEDIGTSSNYIPAAGPHVAFDLVQNVVVHVENAVTRQSIDVSIAPGGSAAAEREVSLEDWSSAADLRSVDWGDGSTGTQQYHYYTSAAVPMTRTVTAHYVDGTGNALPAVSRTITVLPNTVRANLIPPANVLPEGPVTFKTAGTVTPTPGTFYWYMTFGDGTAPIFGYGPVPATFTHTFASGSAYAELEIYPDNGDSAYAEPFITLTSAAPRITYFGGDESGDWVPTTAGPDTANGSPIYFTAGIAPSVGAHAASGTLVFGDGHAEDVTPQVGGGYLSSDTTGHGYVSPGEYVATLTVKDSHNKVATAVNHVSVAGAPTVSSPLTLSATHNTPVTLPLSGVSAGANGQLLMYDISWGDTSTPARPDTIGYGTPPANPTHTYTSAGTYTAYVYIYNDHGASATAITQVTVA